MAVDATGTPTSPDSIPTYATSADAPSGKGFNAAMAAIQTAFNNKASKPSGIVSGEVPVWNGTGWARSSVTPINATNLTGYSNYTPVWSSGGTQPTLGNGGISGRYTQIGKFVHAEILLNLGTTSTIGTGAYSWSLPVVGNFAASTAHGSGYYFDASAGQVYGFIVAHVNSTTVTTYLTNAGPGAFGMSATVPVVPAFSDQYNLSIFYETV